MTVFMLGYDENPKPYFCENCGQLSGMPIQISDYRGKEGENKDVCFDCMAQELARVKAELKEQRKETKKKK